MDRNENLVWQNFGLPEDLARARQAGLSQAAVRLDAMAQDPALLAQQRACCAVQAEMLRRLPADYPFTAAEALAELRRLRPSTTEAEFAALEAENRIDWRWIEGEKRYFRRLASSLAQTQEAFVTDAARRAREQEIKLLQQAHAEMQRCGSAAAHIRLRAELRFDGGVFDAALAKARAAGRSGVRARIWLPLPAECPAQSGIVLEKASPSPAFIAPGDAPQRTVYWELTLAENRPVTLEYSYRVCAAYAEPLQPPVSGSSASAPFLPPEQYLGEQAPQLVFTPFLRALTEAVTAGAASNAEKAARIYDYLTQHIEYRYMPAYFTLENIADGGACALRGDCGVQALTFITMCRIAGIPAAWQSGLMVLPYEAGSHDWAMFWLPEKGWLYADCSFGSSAARRGDETLRRHYFGSLDPFRMAANHAFQAALQPPSSDWRNDPYDNQSGEAELDGRGLWGSEYHTEYTVQAFEAGGQE